MKFKSFGLVEAIISTAIMLLLITGVFYLSAKANFNHSKYLRQEFVTNVANDFFSRVDVIQRAGYLTFGQSSGSDQISVDCLNSSRALDCLGSLSNDSVVRLYPYNDLAKPTGDEYFAISKQKYYNSSLESSKFSMKSIVTDAGQGEKMVELDFRCVVENQTEDYKISQVITDI